MIDNHDSSLSDKYGGKINVSIPTVDDEGYGIGVPLAKPYEDTTKDAAS